MPAPIVIHFGPFEPDSADLNSTLLTVAKEIYPSKNGYAPMKGTAALNTNWGAFSGSVVIQTGPTSYSVYSGAVGFARADSSAIGTKVVLAGAFTPPTTNERWRFTKFGNFLITAHAGQAPLVANWSTSSDFAALAGSPPTASGVYTIEDFVFLTGLASNRRKIQWSAINSHTGWTVGTNLSDEQEFPDGGDVFGIAGGKSGYLIQQNAIRRYQFLPGDTSTIFEFSKLDGIPGCIGPYAWAGIGQSVFYYSEEGFCSIGSQGFQRIGAGRVDRYFAAKGSTISAMVAIADPYNPRVMFFHRASGQFNGAMIYDWALDRWSETALVCLELVEALDGTGGGTVLVVSAAIPTPDLCSLSSSNRSATLTTADMEVFQTGANGGMRAEIQQTRPLVDGAVTSVTISHKEKLSDSYTTTGGGSQQANGWFTYGTEPQTSGTYHKFSVVTTAANAATYHKGLQLKAITAGEA